MAFERKGQKKFRSKNPVRPFRGKTSYNKFRKAKPSYIDEKKEDASVRLNKFIANAGICSRREADQIIQTGEISINGNVITQLGTKVNPGDIVKFNGRVLHHEKPVYILLNKPKGYITTTRDQNERETVLDLVKGACRERIYPVGRLDRNTTGLLILTNDGDLAKKLSHPSYEVRKIYEVGIDRPIQANDLASIRAGINLDDGFIKVDEIAVISPDRQKMGIEIHSGRNRVIRRIFESLNYKVTKLDRSGYANLTKKDLPRGKWRFLEQQEVIRLKHLKSGRAKSHDKHE